MFIQSPGLYEQRVQPFACLLGWCQVQALRDTSIVHHTKHQNLRVFLCQYIKIFSILWAILQVKKINIFVVFFAILCVGSNPTPVTSCNEIKLKVHPYNNKLTWSSEVTWFTFRNSASILMHDNLIKFDHFTKLKFSRIPLVANSKRRCSIPCPGVIGALPK